jgi:hypothetical protein
MFGEVLTKMAQNATKDGSPGLLTAVGRVFGLGQAEQNALVSKGVPGWLWLVGGLGVGVVVGIQVQSRWPRRVPKVLQANPRPGAETFEEDDDDEEPDVSELPEGGAQGPRHRRVRSGRKIRQ